MFAFAEPHPKLMYYDPSYMHIGCLVSDNQISDHDRTTVLDPDSPTQITRFTEAEQIWADDVCSFNLHAYISGQVWYLIFEEPVIVNGKKYFGEYRFDSVQLGSAVGQQVFCSHTKVLPPPTYEPTFEPTPVNCSMFTLATNWYIDHVVAMPPGNEQLCLLRALRLACRRFGLDVRLKTAMFNAQLRFGTYLSVTTLLQSMLNRQHDPAPRKQTLSSPHFSAIRLHLPENWNVENHWAGRKLTNWLLKVAFYTKDRLLYEAAMKMSNDRGPWVERVQRLLHRLYTNKIPVLFNLKKNKRQRVK